MTLTRTVAIALAGGAIIAYFTDGIAGFPGASLLVLWPSLGGHFVEVWYLNWLRPRLPANDGIRKAFRVAAWFAGGVVLLWGMRLTAGALGWHRSRILPAWWVGGLGLIAIEMVIHLFLRPGKNQRSHKGNTADIAP